MDSPSDPLAREIYSPRFRELLSEEIDLGRFLGPSGPGTPGFAPGPPSEASLLPASTQVATYVGLIGFIARDILRQERELLAQADSVIVAIDRELSS